ncbi:MAG: hypothetical protein UW01_C0020G0004 [Candidatus Nomurabacteria bacterium GW2011_GWA2_43_66]|uniref:DUF2127 domain-containing protein n=2 Tax=Candidatus Vebleniibacteriota TaxID=1817921 RepID=A0A1G2Q310_9BACT|nr:MAG: hypothetical protein UW01_C0020G0004 [Candidatus Nomurabacteria bacterium GW2011_GWA2_43_66]OHA54419.1 MAG: hypothetical protein A2226_02300 [Candidatus Veblenbacteria bacterium RIFOXYA2_FULL_43_9]OHA56444.1 MAG: hypothetical protein A2441_03370 [Candidatus Veblenbacteria bacterium RIFOXYC2_FULL_42_11]HCU47510.1 hypothetical protein [Patescibacteria group bacterium]
MKKTHVRPLSLRLVVLYKFILGLVELIFGSSFVLLTLGAQEVSSSGVVQKIISKELGEDPNDLFVHWLLTHNLPFPISTALHLSLLVLALGIIKLIIAYSIWQHSHKAKILSIILVSALGIGGMIEIWQNFGWFKVVATIIDFLLLYYLAFVLPKHIEQDKSRFDITDQTR